MATAKLDLTKDETMIIGAALAMLYKSQVRAANNAATTAIAEAYKNEAARTSNVINKVSSGQLSM